MVSLPDDPDLLIVAASPGGQARKPGAAKAARAGKAARARASTSGPASARAVKAMAQRLDFVTAMTRLLLENTTFSESVTLQRCARLLAGEFATWVIVDIERDGRLTRQCVMGPQDERSEEVARNLGKLDPQPGSAPRQVHEAKKSVLRAHAEDTAVVGTDADGVPVLMLIGATSVLSVPISDGKNSYGTLTLARPASAGQFDIADLGLAEELGEQLAIALRVDRLTDELAGLAGRSAAEMVAAVRDRVTSFSGNQLRDDMTILALKADAPSG